MVDWSKIIPAVLYYRQWTQTRLARELGISASYVSQLRSGLRGRQPSQHLLQHFARVTGTTVNALEGKEALTFKATEGAPIISEVATKDTPRRRLSDIPIIGSVPAGLPRSAVKIRPGDYVSFLDVDDPKAFALRVDGDCMEPEIRKGEIVVISPGTSAQNGDIALVSVGNQHTLTRVWFDPLCIVLQPLNPRHSIAVYDNHNEPKIEGKAVWVGRRLG